LRNLKKNQKRKSQSSRFAIEGTGEKGHKAVYDQQKGLNPKETRRGEEEDNQENTKL